MKLNVKRIQHLNLDYDGFKYQLIENIFKDIFGYGMNQIGIYFEYDESKDVLKIQQDVSIHGSSIYETVKEIKDKKLIDIYFSLKDVCLKLKEYESKN